jgi:alkaline phosphatase D
MSRSLSRRGFLGLSLAAAAGMATRARAAGSHRQSAGAPAIITSPQLRPVVPSGIQTGDVTDTRAIVWSRADRPAQLVVDWATNDAFRDARRVVGPAALEHTAFTAAVDLRDLPPGEQIVYRARFESLEHPGAFSEALTGRFRTAPSASASPRPLRVAWSGDTVGQGWGIDHARGGLRMFDALRRAEPDVFIHSGDMIYADGPLLPEVPLDDGSVWRNVVTEAKSKVAETLEEFRGNFAYHLLDEHARRFHGSVPIIAQWDDHEVSNNWFPGLQLDHDARYTVKSASLLAARARQAMAEFVPMRRHPDEANRVYRRFAYGPLLDIFVVDLRTYRGPNTANRQTAASDATTIFGATQLAWLQDALRSSSATWKVIACDMPIGLVVSDRARDGGPTFEAFANADGGAPSGRELEMASLLRFIRRERIRNTVWVTADVHYAAAHHYAPDRAAFTDFDPFWEFVAGPMHAGTFGPNGLDATFGPEVRFSSIPRGLPGNRPPSDNFQFYGTLDIDPATRALTVGIWDVTGRRLWQTEIAASA